MSNNTSWYILIANCWDPWLSPNWGYEGEELPCTGYGSRTGNQNDARTWLAPGEWSSESAYFKYYDTDAVRFPGGCLTTFHYWGHLQGQVDRRGGFSSIWFKILDIDHIYIDRIVC